MDTFLLQGLLGVEVLLARVVGSGSVAGKGCQQFSGAGGNSGK